MSDPDPIIWKKMWASDTFTTDMLNISGQGNSGQLIYLYQNRAVAAGGFVEQDEVDAYAQGNLPTSFNNVSLRNFTARPVNHQTWIVTGDYGRTVDYSGTESFDTTGGSQHITQSLSTRRYGSNVPNFHGAIGVANNNVEGVDIVVPVFNFQKTRYAWSVSNATKRTLAELTGTVNDWDFDGYDPGEVLFLGATGSQDKSGSTALWTLTFKFAASVTRDGFSVGSIDGIRKAGWEYMWVLYEEATDQNALVKVPKGVFIEQVYEEGDFNGLGL